MNKDVLVVHGPMQARLPLVLDSPHSGFQMPSDFRANLSDSITEADLRDGEDCLIDQLYLPAAEMGIPLLAAQYPRTWLDPNRHAGDIDLALMEGGHWPDALVPSGKARIGKALIWRTLDDGRPICARPLSVQAVRERIARYHQPYHDTLQALLSNAHAAFGVVYHINCHSMNAVSGSMGEGGPGVARADMVLGDRDGTTCDPAFTEFVRSTLTGFGYEVKVNDPFKGVELVRAYSDPAQGRHSLQLEVNKRLYMHGSTGDRHAGFDALQAHLMALLQRIGERFGAGKRPG
jgi:N-formylglutamate amidohydrolase